MGIDLAWAQELSWAAGFYDGEGSCSYRASTGAVRIQIAQRHREPLERFQAAFGVGKIYVHVQRGRPMYAYTAGPLLDTRYVCDLLRPLVTSIKREQLDLAWKRRADGPHHPKGSPEHYAKLELAARKRPRRRHTDGERRAISEGHLAILREDS